MRRIVLTACTLVFRSLVCMMSGKRVIALELALACLCKCDVQAEWVIALELALSSFYIKQLIGSNL
jgi:hypothetical protein